MRASVDSNATLDTTILVRRIIDTVKTMSTQKTLTNKVNLTIFQMKL